MNAEATIFMEAERASMCLYVFSPSKQDRLYQLQRDTLAENLRTLSGHHITIAEVFEHEQGHIGNEELPCDNCHKLRQQFHVIPGQFKVILSNGQSSVKLCAESCVSCEEVIMRIENEPVEPKHTFY